MSRALRSSTASKTTPTTASERASMATAGPRMPSFVRASHKARRGRVAGSLSAAASSGESVGAAGRSLAPLDSTRSRRAPFTFTKTAPRSVSVSAASSSAGVLRTDQYCSPMELLGEASPSRAVRAVSVVNPRRRDNAPVDCSDAIIRVAASTAARPRQLESDNA